jgi:hypothetical protein
MAATYQPIRLAKDQPILRRRSTRKSRPADLERIQRDFWTFFDLDKFAADWRGQVGRQTAA